MQEEQNAKTGSKQCTLNNITTHFPLFSAHYAAKHHEHCEVNLLVYTPALIYSVANNKKTAISYLMNIKKTPASVTKAWAHRLFCWTIICYLALVAAIVIHYAIYRDHTLWSVFLIQVISLLLPAYGLFKKQTRSAAWLCFILCFYFIGGVLAISSAPVYWFGWSLAGLSAILFVLLILFIRHPSD
ncbi:hypothetical protein CI610_02649 [invertebrate metagenome]|uniref:Uncharacterized protein n=1 Tax=invertebrate metagenome TaxID=1711999 RepID=A0A2H9T5C8_9ZZZZ